MNDFAIPEMAGPSIELKHLNADCAACLTSLMTESVFQYLCFRLSSDPTADAYRFVDLLLSLQNAQPYLILSSYDKEPIGVTCVLDGSTSHKRAEIGWTAILPQHWGLGYSFASKILLMSWLFDKMNCNRVAFTADERNSRSRHALLRLGAKEEGIARMVTIMPDGFVRNSILYSILKPEWESVRPNN